MRLSKLHFFLLNKKIQNPSRFLFREGILSTILCFNHLPHKVTSFRIFEHASEVLSELGLLLPLNEDVIITYGLAR